MTNSLLKVSNLHASYGRAKVLFGIDFSIQNAEVITLLGRNGMGRSTTIKCLFGLLASAQGEIEFNQQRIEGLESFEIARKGLALVPEGRQVFPNLTVEENLIATARLNKNQTLQPWDLKRVYQFFPRLNERRNNLGSQLSGGEQQRVAVARALINDPKIIFADEPSGNLDSKSAQDLHELFFKLRDEFGQSFVIVTHNQELAQMADRMLTMQDGKIVSGI